MVNEPALTESYRPLRGTPEPKVRGLLAAKLVCSTAGGSFSSPE